MFKRFSGLFVLAMALCVSMVNSVFAALDATTLTEIQTGISGADANYYAIGGSILVVLAGIWGFRLVKRLL